MLNMSGLSFRSLTFMLFVAFLLWSSNFEICNARRGRHWRQSRGSSASLAKKKWKSQGKGNYHHSGGSKPKSPPHKAPSTPKPKEDLPSSPPGKGSNGGHSVTFNVLDFGAKGDGSTDDTQVILHFLFVQTIKKKMHVWCCWETYGLHARIPIFPDKYNFFIFPKKIQGNARITSEKMYGICMYCRVVGSIHRSSLI